MLFVLISDFGSTTSCIIDCRYTSDYESSVWDYRALLCASYSRHHSFPRTVLSHQLILIFLFRVALTSRYPLTLNLHDGETITFRSTIKGNTKRICRNKCLSILLQRHYQIHETHRLQGKASLAEVLVFIQFRLAQSPSRTPLLHSHSAPIDYLPHSYALLWV